ncbi:MAG: hypothetical protein NTW87_30635 [Planctomycetota bacterium]|nr:hypothetical protein [Planctomycetota bacterium]
MVSMCAEGESLAALLTRRRTDGQLFRLALQEAEKHKWIESEKAGRDLGEAALYDWSRRYWRYWCRDRWIEHLSGERYWSELDQQDFGLLRHDFHRNTALIAQIVEHIKKGGENLDIICWAQKNNQDMKDLLEILLLLDINSRRLSFWPA